MRKTMDIISRKTSLKNEFTAQGNTAVAMNESGIVVIHDSVKNVASYERSGNDLIIHMQDGSVIRCVGYFENIGEKDENKLVFQDGKQELTEVTFTDAAVAHDAPVFALHAVETPLAGIESLLLSTTEVTVEWPYLLGGALGVGAVGALLAHGGGSDEKTKVIDNTKAVEVAQPTFLVTDTQGDSQGILANQAVTDDTRPTFTGTGYPGADIAIVDASGNIIATALVDSNGQWTAQLAPQAAGSHTYIVVQESNGSTTSAGSITLTVVTAKASLSIDTMAGDNVLNAAEAGSDFAISGKSDNLAAGTTVTVSLNGASWQTTVGADGAWSVKVPAADAQALADGVYTVQVSGVDRAGNTITSSSSLAVDTHLPSLTIATLAGDDMLNAAEAGKDLTLSGTSDAGAGRVVTLNLNGQTYTATVGADGNWSATVPAAQAGALADGNVTISASVSDAAGNSTSTTHDLRVDTTVPVVTIDTIAGDNILNSAEQTQAQIVSGTSTGGEAGDTVTLLVNGQTYTTTLTADGSWSIGLPASVFSSVADGSYTVSVSITDKAGNTGSQSTTVLVSSEVPELAINTVATDDIINAIEKGNALEISGTSNSADGTPVSLTLNGVTYSGTVSGGHWSVTVPASDVSKLGEATYTLSASSTDAEGNSGAATHNVVVDSVLPTVSIAVTAGDNIINATEIDTDQTLSGKVANAAAGDVVTVTVGGNIYTTTVQDDLSWSVSVPSADLKGFGDGDLTISASVTNQHGNTGSADRDIAIDAGLPGLRIDTVAGDDIVNSIEIQQNQIISGTSTDIAAGSSVTVTVNGVDYQATVGANGAWSAAIPSADVANWPAGQLAISVTGSDISGNSVTISNNVTVDLSSVAISVDTIAVDDMINSAEKAADLTLTGTTQNVEAGQTVTVNFAGHNYTTTVQANGGWSVTVPAGDMTSLKDGDVTATASVTNVAGNSASAANTAEVDASAPAITINTLAGDNVLNSAEAGADVVLSGTSTAEAGQVVTVTVNGNDYTATVGNDGTWSTSVPAADAATLADGTYSVTATVKDVAGNSSSATGSVLVDVTAPTLSINTVSTDDVINAQELQQNLMITGSSTGVPAGGLVTVDIDGNSYTAAVDANGNWSVGVPADVVSTLTDGSYTVTASVKDAAGNDGSVTHDVTVDTVSPVLTINTVAADDVINAIEKGEALTVSGTSDGADGSTVTLNFNGTNYTATVSNGAWTLDVPATDVAKLGEADYTLTASSTDAAGNTGNTSHVVLVDSALPTVSISPVATDNVINATEINTDQLIGGKVTNATAGDVVTITLGGNTYTATVQDDLSWSVSVPSADLKGFGDGDLTVSASVTNQHGNTGSADREIAIDAGLPGLRIDTVAGDDIVNSIEIQQNQIISGTSTDIAAGSSVTVTINGVDYQATVGANGAWSAAIPSADVANWPAGQLAISVTGSDISGNSVTISNNVTVDLSSVAISVDTIAADDMINAAEKAADLTLTGTTQNVEAGQTVTVNFAGHTYTTTVQSGGSWSVTVPAGDMSSLKDGDVTATASVTNVAGNSASAANTAEVDASAPAITINTIAGDNVLNLAEAGADVLLSGTSTAEAGQVVTVTVNGNDYTATVGTDGTWSTSVPAADAAALTDGTYSVTATVKDVAGNSSSATGSVLVDITAPTLTINTVSADDVINAQELQQNLMITGSSTGVPAGGLVTVDIDGNSYTAAVDANGNWSVGVPADVVSTLTDGSYTVTASVKDAAGNDGSVTHDVTVDTVSPVLTINTVAADDVINTIEKGEALTVSGTSNGTDGSVITLNLNGQNYTATVSNGTWTLNVPATDVAKLGEADYTLTASSTDAAGNTGNTSHTVLVDSALPTVSISPVATDNVINATEINTDQLIGGKVTNAAAGDVVTITLGGNTYTATVQDDLSWSVSVPSADLKGFGDGDLTISASVTNQHGNTGTNDRDINIDAGLPGLRIDTVAGDDIVNSIEIQQNQIISGTSTDIAAGSSVTVTVNGVDYQATVGANGAWSAAVPAADVANWPAGQLAISVTGSDTSGNSVTISNNVTVDLSSVAISVDTIEVDDMINAAEKAADLTLTGTTQNVEAGQTVTVNFAGHTYTTTVQANGSWSVTVPAGDMTSLKDGDVTATASVTNVAGNSASAANTAEVDASAPTLTINTIAGDNVLNSAEAGADVVLSGTSTAEAGQVVTVTVNGNDYTATVGTDGTWSTVVPAADAAALTDGTYSVSATVKDVAGNSSSATGSLLVDVTAPTLSINAVSTDDVINAQEHQQNLMISGGSTGVPAGGLVTVDIDGHSYTAAVDANGNWSVGVPADVVSTLTDGGYTVTASVKDAAGNDGSVTHDVTVDTVSPVLTINTVAADDVINAIEKGEALTVSGTSDGTDGSTVTLNFNGTNYTATVSNGAWTLDVPATDVAKLGEADYTLTASSTDAAGNTGSTSHTVLVDSALPTVSISPVATDNVINATEINADQLIGGKVTNAAAGDVVTITLGGNTYTATVQDDLSWSVSVPSADLKGFGDGDLTISASVTNQHGNTGTNERDIAIDAGLPGLRIDTVAGDDIVNSIEIQQNQIISGTSTDIAAGSSVTVTVNGVDYQATVGANGAWSAAVPAADVANWPAGQLAISVTGSDTSGNSVTISNNVTVDLSSVAISVDTIAVDDMINAAEKAADLTLTGSTQNVEAGQTVTVNFAGHTYIATVQANGGWSVTVPAGDMTGLKDGDVTATASVTNVAGNSASAANTAEVDASAPTVTIQTISASDVLNAINAGTEVTLSGTSTAQAGQTVTITLGSETYTATVAADGTWTTGVPNSVFSGLGDGSYTLTASVSDIAGNPATATGTAQVDLTAPVVTINTVAGDDVINSTEHGQAQVISGTVTGVDAGSVVTVTVNNVDYRAVSDGSGNWSVGVPANVVSGLNDGSYTLTAQVTDTAGNTGSANRDVTVETTAPVFVINDMAGGDNILNAAEAQATLTVTGTVTGLADGATVIVTLNGLNYQGTVSGGVWSADIPASDLANLGQALYQVSVSGTDVYGNSGSSAKTLQTSSDSPAVTINTVAGDDVINATEITQDQVISGTVTHAEAGQTVTVTVGGKTYTAEVQNDLSWSLTVPAADLVAMGDGSLNITASVTNTSGNSGSGERDITIDAAIPGLRIDTIAGDDIVNSIEIQQNQIVSGTSSGLAAGSSVTVTINGVDYAATVGAGGKWSAAVAAADVANWPAGELSVSVSGTSSAGNSVTISHDITVDLSSVSIAIDTVSTDNMLNAAEKAADLTLSGTTQNVEAGQTVTVIFAGHSYTAQVQTGGAWSLTVPAADMSNLKDGDAEIRVSVTNTAGNSASAAQDVTVDTVAPTITLNTIAGDNVLNSVEAGADVVLSGTSTAEAGQVVIVTVNGNDYTATVGTDGSWSTVVPAADAQALTDGTYSVSATVSDVAGNSSSATGSLLVDVTGPTLSINTVSTDDVINAQEHQQNLMISGSSTGVPAGGLVTVDIDGHSYTAAVDANGNWSVGVPANVVSTLTDGSYTVSATVKDAAGNDGSVTHDVTVDTVSPVLTINTVAADDVINAIEKGEALTVSGTSDGTDGSTVTLNFNGTNYTATVSNGAWTLDVPATDVAKLGEADYTLTASSTDAAGNTGSTSHSVLVDSALPSVTISPVATDNVINATEINTDQLIGGKVTNAAAGDVVTITLGGNTYTATVQDDLSWSVSVPSADLKGFGDGDLTISTSVTNQHGNTGTNDRDIAIDASLPGLRIDTVAGDDVVNSIEIQQNQIISGTSTDIAAGSSVTVTINGVDYQATVGANGAWSAAVPAADVANWPAGALNISVTGSDTSGNSVTISNNVTVDLSRVAISVDTIATDDMINAAEKAADLTLTGSTQNVEAGQTVTVNFAGHTYTTTVQANGGWSVTVPAGDMTSLKDGDVTATASVTNVAGNSASAANTAEVDASAPAITINTIAGDNILNLAEAGADVVLSGTSTAEVGQVVTVTVNGNDYTATVGNDGTWSTSVPAADAQALTDGTYSVTATVKDVAGNSSSATGSVLVDITAPVVSVNTVAGDDVINAAEHSQAQVISGGSTGTQPGNLVTLVIGGVTYSTAVDASGNWSVGVPADVIKGLASGENTISVSITDSAGNTGSSDHLITVNTDAVSLSIDTIAQDDIINAAEKGTSLTISGGSDMLATGTEVTVVLNGKSYTADVNANGDWTLSVPANDLAAMADGNYTVTASANDAAGNPASATHNVVVDATAPALLINPVTASGMLNAAELGQPLTLSGTSTAQAGQTVSVTLNNETYTTTVNANGTWTVNLPADDVAALTDGTLTVTASTTDVAGNPVSANTSVIVDTVAPTLTINTIAGDDIINTTEQQAGQTLSGTTSAEAGQIVTVTFNNREYHATVTADGTWSLNVPAADFNGAADGSYTVSASVSDVAGNPAATDSSVSLSGAVPEITINTFAQDDVVSAAEHGGPLAITGTSTATAGSTVTVTLNGVTYTTQVGSDQNWTLNLSANAVSALADGENYSITASVTNSIGNSGSVSHDIAVDTTAPSMTITIDSVSDDTGRSTSDFVTSDNTLTLNGALSAALGNNESAQISLDGGVTWNTLTVTGTTWNYAQGSALADGSYTYNVRVIDAAGNVGSTASQTVVIDTVASDASQTISIDAVSQDTGLSSSDFITSDTTLNLRGTLGAAPGADEYVQISLDGGTTWNDVSISGLTWTYIDGRTLTDGDYNYQMRVVDLAGNVGATASQVVTIDTTTPDSSKTVSVDAISTDTGLSSTDFVTSDTSLTVTGSLGATLAADEVVQVSTDGGLTWANATTIGTGWTFTDGRTLTDGDYTYNVRVVDTAGNVGNVTSKVVTVDTVAPDASKTVTIDSIATDTGSSASDFVTSDTSLTVTGSIGAELSPGEVVQISVDNGATWTTVTLQGSTWTYVDGRTLTDGQTLYQVRVVDQAGNVGQTAQQVVTIDTTAPTQIITIDAVSNDTGDSASDFITSDNTLTMTGSLSAALATDERAQISLDGGKTWTDVVVNGVGWSYDATGTVLADGNYNVQVRVIDQAGNVGTIGSQTVVIDTLNPEAVATIVQYSDDEGDRTGSFGSGTSTDETAPTLSGTLSKAMADGEVLKIYRNGVFVGVATVVGLAWTFSDSALADGTYVYVATSQDLAGNTTSSTDFTLKVDTSIPTTMATVTGESTQDTTPVISGTLSEALGEGMYVQVVVNGVTYTSETGGAVVVDPLNNTWYLQVPGALGLASYDVTAQVRSSAGNGNDAGISTSAIIVYAETAVDTSWATTAGATSTNAMAFSLNSGGLWNIVTGISDYSSSDLNSYAGTTLTNSRGNIVVSYTLADTDRNGTSDIYATETNYGGSIQGKWTANADGTYTYGQQAIGTTIWYGGVIAYDKTGDGWVDLAYGDAGGDSRSYLVNNNGVLSADGSAGAAGLAGVTYREISGIDINNDGTVDIVQHTNRNGAYALTVVSNNGTGTLSETQNIANVFVVNSADSTTAASMTWADFNGDGYMDLYISTGRNTTTSTNYGGVIYYNDGNGNLLTTTTQVEASTTSSAAGGYLSAAVDWDGDGDMDIIKFSTYSASQKATLYLNDGTGKGWSSSALASSLVNVTGIATLDYDWNGTQDLLVSQANGKVVYVANNSTIADGTAIHLRILDGEGMNVFYGNTVQLYNAAGELVASQIINAQSGIGINDASALVNFYGLDPNETYSAVLVRNINGVSSNATWTDLTAGDGTSSYSLTADAATGGNSGTITGTGYNDTFVAESGTYVYNGSGGWSTSSDHATWSATGGQDIVDYRNATSGITVDLSSSNAQNTGFNTSTFRDIEGIAGSDYDDVITGSAGDNLFEGRGGNDTFNLASGGHDTLLYKLLDSSDATGGNGSDTINGFTVGTWEGTANSDRLDLSDLLQSGGYTGTGSASYVNGVATLDASAGNITDYLSVTTEGNNTVIKVDMDGSGSAQSMTTIATLTNVHTDLATLLANHQLIVG
ncbi:Ig-like domain-containing protein [Rahnella victoriana]|uniref:Ig-like domain-containing protein n=1 Tax=Rahnella victoriana TaxID=1510570 RepID=A0ABS0DVC3_9GAMM|nr:Ig-like domain-containing protein [Rahnella victoriana]MBF7957585.1 Ig-like domain-containing protein [Rahnella victoriana]